jgi:hypothetical protein
MFTRIYWTTWVIILAAAAFAAIAGYMTMFGIVVFGFLAFGMVWVGMICLLPAIASHGVHETTATPDATPAQAAVAVTLVPARPQVVRTA